MTVGPERVAERLREALRQPFRVQGYEGLPISVTASIGIATGPRPSAQELLRDADVALYQAKAEGRDRWVLFEAAMQSAAVDRLELKSDLDAAVTAGQFFLAYQPIFDLGLGGVRASRPSSAGITPAEGWSHRTSSSPPSRTPG